MGCCAIVIISAAAIVGCVLAVSLAAAEINPARSFKNHNGKRQIGVTPREMTQSGEGRSKRSHCGVECFRRQWCRSFNIIHSTGECELFDVKASGEQLISEADSSYYEKISNDVRECEVLPVMNGVDIAEGKAHQETVNISCDAGFSSFPLESVICDDGTFTDDKADNGTVVVIVNATCTVVTCGELLVANGSSVGAGTPNEGVVDIVCDVGLHSYYTTAKCVDGVFVPSRALCGVLDFPSPSDAASFSYHGQFLKAFDNPLVAFETAGDVCAAEGGIMATALSAHLLLVIKPIVPRTETGGVPQTMVGLKQKSGQSGTNIGWQWIDSASGDVIDIDTGNTVEIPWIPYRPNDLDGVEDNGAQYATILQENSYYGINDGQNNAYHQKKVLCQIDLNCHLGYPWYEFSVVAVGSRISSPQERMMAGVNVINCTTTCIQSAFCRAFSFSLMLSDCRHHSIPPDDPEAVIVSDANYDIYA